MRRIARTCLYQLCLLEYNVSRYGAEGFGDGVEQIIELISEEKEQLASLANVVRRLVKTSLNNRG